MPSVTISLPFCSPNLFLTKTVSPSRKFCFLAVFGLIQIGLSLIRSFKNGTAWVWPLVWTGVLPQVKQSSCPSNVSISLSFSAPYPANCASTSGKNSSILPLFVLSLAISSISPFSPTNLEATGYLATNLSIIPFSLNKIPGSSHVIKPSFSSAASKFTSPPACCILNSRMSFQV